MVALHQNFPAAYPRAHIARRSRRVAVVLNANARRVDEETLSWFRSTVPADELFVSRSLDDAERIAGEVVAQGFDAVLWGGGDGTFARGVGLVARAAERAGRRVPEMGALRLGTGNAIADTIGVGPATREGVRDDLVRARASAGRRKLPFLEIEGQPALFCGFGLDAQILDDFGATVATLRKLGLASAVKSADARYFLSVTSRSIPRFLTSQRPEIVAINRGAPALAVDVEGRPIGAPIPAGRVLWRGKATLASAGTIPFYGLGLRVFPHAERMPGRFQLRVTDLGAAQILGHLPAIWRGRYHHRRLHDFLVDDVELVLARPAPLQANGDLLGPRDRLRVSFWNRAVSVV
jgi:diacylglycerol kinase family enzyme